MFTINNRFLPYWLFFYHGNNVDVQKWGGGGWSGQSLRIIGLWIRGGGGSNLQFWGKVCYGWPQGGQCARVGRSREGGQGVFAGSRQTNYIKLIYLQWCSMKEAVAITRDLCSYIFIKGISATSLNQGVSVLDRIKMQGLIMFIQSVIMG